MNAGSLRNRLILAAAFWLTIALAAAAGLLRYSFADSIERSFDQRLIAALRSVVGLIEEGPDGKPRIVKSLGDPRFEQPLSGWYWQATGQNVLLRSRSLWDSSLPVRDDHEKFQLGTTVGPDGESLITAERDLSLPGSDAVLHVVVAAARHDIQTEIRRFDKVLLGVFAVLAAGLAASVAAQIGFGLRPLRRLTQDLTALREKPGERLANDYPSELMPLTGTVNALLDHDSALLDRARAHMGNLAHSLKTPLAVLQTELQSGEADAKEMENQIIRLTRLVEHHLTRARAQTDSSRAVGRSIPVAPVLEDAARMLRRFNAGRGLSIIVEAEAHARFQGGAEDLAEMAGNLMENACKWAKSTIRVRAAGGMSLEILVEDDGPGLDERSHGAVIRRGARLDETAPGHGLGLAIVADLAQLHGGRLEMSRSELGGLAAALRFA